jgi:hypothetical protein
MVKTGLAGAERTGWLFKSRFMACTENIPRVNRGSYLLWLEIIFHGQDLKLAVG